MGTCPGAGRSRLEHLTPHMSTFFGEQILNKAEFLSHRGSVPWGRGLFGNPEAGFAALSSRAHGHLEQKAQTVGATPSQSEV